MTLGESDQVAKPNFAPLTNANSRSTEVIVIGAGIAGLTAGYTLSRQGFSVTVLEATDRVGGRMSTDREEGFILDRGAQFLSSEYTILNGLIRELGLESSLHETSGWSSVVRDGRLRRVRSDRALTLLTSGLLTPYEWSKCILGLARNAGTLTRRPLNDLSCWRDHDFEWADEWGGRVLGQGALNYLIEPSLEGFYFQGPEATSRALAMAVLGFGLRRSKTLTLLGGIGTLPEALASRQRVLLESPVTDIEVQQDAVSVKVPGGKHRADYAILATTASAARGICSTGPDEQELLATTYRPNLNLSLLMKPEFRLPAEAHNVYGLLIPRKERRRVAAVGIERNKCQDRAHSSHALNVMLSGEASVMLFDLEETDLVREVVLELEAYLPGVTRHVMGARLHRWMEAEPESRVGRAWAAYRYRKACEMVPRRVVLAGDYTSMPFTEGAAESGMWAASLIQAYCLACGS